MNPTNTVGRPSFIDDARCFCEPPGSGRLPLRVELGLILTRRWLASFAKSLSSALEQLANVLHAPRSDARSEFYWFGIAARCYAGPPRRTRNRKRSGRS